MEELSQKVPGIRRAARRGFLADLAKGSPSHLAMLESTAQLYGASNACLHEVGGSRKNKPQRERVKRIGYCCRAEFALWRTGGEPFELQPPRTNKMSTTQSKQVYKTVPSTATKKDLKTYTRDEVAKVRYEQSGDRDWSRGRELTLG